MFARLFLLVLMSFFCFSSAIAQNQDRMQDSPEAQSFIMEMSKKYQISASWLSELLNPIEPNQTVLNAILPPSVTGSPRSWSSYRAKFNNRIVRGLQFWKDNEAVLNRAEQRFGVPAEIIVSIIGVETFYGRIKGKFSVLRSLATLAFYYPPRAEYFRSELEQFLLFCREMHYDPTTLLGSYAGAIGIPQFMPGSIRRYAIDFDGDGLIDLNNNSADAIGSVANFLVEHGWVKGSPITQRAKVQGDPEKLIEAGILPSLTYDQLSKAGVTPSEKALANFDTLIALIDLPDYKQPTEYWLGYQNFYVITRYNRSNFYAMSVFQVAESLRNARNLIDSNFGQSKVTKKTTSTKKKVKKKK